MHWNKSLLYFHRYQIALGTTPGGGQIKPFFDIDLEDGVRYYTIGGLNLVGYRVVSLKLF